MGGHEDKWGFKLPSPCGLTAEYLSTSQKWDKTIED